ncbi:MAG: hypothetical protein HQL97_10285 [Magnetococcales bacterium]|nr:hypothetical protein [Magnetococcales bacterium]
MRYLALFCSILMAPLFAGRAEAVEFLFSGYGTVSYSVSDRPYAYQRFIDDHGTILSDTILGMQLDTRFNNHFSATLQGRVAPAIDPEEHWDPKISWAFLSWKPTDNWLLRAGKMRVPLYLNAENKDVGVTFDVVRLPGEIYGLAPTSDFVGASINKTWSVNDDDWILDAYWGRGDTDIRVYLRDGVPGTLAAGEHYSPLEIEMRGMVLTYHRKRNDTYRVGFHLATPRAIHGNTWSYDLALVSPLPGVSYYTDTAPGIQTYDQITMPIFSLGTSINLFDDYTLSAEYFHSQVQEVGGITHDGGYVTLQKRIDKWTPYVTFAGLHSGSRLIDRYRMLSESSVPNLVPGAALINASQRALADSAAAFDQTSWTTGITYAFSPISKVKGEWTNVRTGNVHGFVDAPSGGSALNQNLNILTFSYSFAF